MLETLNDFTRTLGTFWGVLSLMVLCAPAAIAVHEFTAYRMNQYSLGGNDFGCKSNVVNFEARSVNANIVTRRCVLLSMGEVTVDRMKELIDNKAGAILISIPQNSSQLTDVDVEGWNEVESLLMEAPIDTSVYFTYEQAELATIYHQVRTGLNSDHAATAVAALGNVFHSNGYQIVTYGTAPAPAKSVIYTVQGKLTSQSREANPSIAIVAHFDSFGIAPHLAKSANSNGSGVAAFLELARLLAKLYNTPGSVPKYDILFLLTGAGKLNYLSSKTWMERKMTSDSPDGTLLSEAEFVLCIDSVGNEALNIHLSKQPKAGTPAERMLRAFKEATDLLYPNTTIQTIPKKVNLGNPSFAWHHEVFTVKRLSAGTLSNYPSHTTSGRLNTFDETVDSDLLLKNTHIIAEAVGRYISEVSDKSIAILQDRMVPNKDMLARTVQYLSTTQRAAPLLTKESSVISFLEQMMEKFTSEVIVSEFKASKRDPEFQFYDNTEVKLFAYNVKPAVFDLFLAIAVFAYLGTVYLCIKAIPHVLTAIYQSKKLKSS